MTLANMRANGMRHLALECQEWRHSAVLLVDTLSDEIYVPDAGELFRCSKCNSKQVLTRPASHLQYPKPFGMP